MNRWISIAVCIAVWVYGGPAESKPPTNIVVLLADDLGFDDVGINNPVATTPNLDRLAGESVQFSNFYVNAQCAPTRAALLTGRQFFRTGVWGVHGGRDYINLRETLLPELFLRNGYATGVMGKWHSGKGHRYYPWQRGFSTAHMARLYQHSPEMRPMDAVNGRVVDVTSYADEHFADAAIEFIDANHDTPFFLYVPSMSPHAHWRAPQDLIDKQLAKGHSESLSVFFAMTEFMDQQYGRILDRLKEYDLEEKTLVLFFSDNGPLPSGGAKPPPQKGTYKTTGKDWGKRNPHGLRGGKGSMYENGIKSVLYVRQKQRFTPRMVDEVTNVADLYPTLLDLTEVPLSKNQLPLDGLSLAPLLNSTSNASVQIWKNRPHFFASPAPNGTIGKWFGGNGGVAHPPVNKVRDVETFAFANINLAIRRGDYKYVQINGKQDLFNIRTDPREKSPVRDQPERSTKMEGELREWWSSVLNEPSSFQKPLQIIGGDQPAVIYAAGAYETTGNARLKTLFVDGFNQPGDGLKMKVKVEDPGTYRVLAHYTTTPPPTKADFLLTIADQEVGFKVKHGFTQRRESGLFEYDENAFANIGTVTLDQTELAELTISLVHNPVKRHALNSLHFLIFEKLNER